MSNPYDAPTNPTEQKPKFRLMGPLLVVLITAAMLLPMFLFNSTEVSPGTVTSGPVVSEQGASEPSSSELVDEEPVVDEQPPVDEEPATNE